MTNSPFKQARLDAGLTQKAAAQKIGCTARTVSKLDAGHRPIAVIREAAARVFGVPADELF